MTNHRGQRKPVMHSEQFKHIQKIRGEFLQASKIERVRDSLNNAIQNLAEGLYSKNLHFIFELIQNAEDNKYKDQNRYQPYISFRLTKSDPTCTVGSDGALIIENNEIGFNHDNVSAICAVGKTTKKKEQGYIGEKGIGFKSVFRVTENPHIFSRGYNFCLPESDEETEFGYIVPRWINSPPEGLDLSKTHIILPLTKQNFGYEEIEKMLQDIEPEIILFLSMLQEIHIKTDTGDDFTILKDDSAMPEVQIVAEGKKQGIVFSNSDDFLICTGRFDKPADIHQEKREQIKNRYVTIGFPLDEKSTAVGKIFAYLPVRWDTGFPFLINADFILPSSREDIQDVPWNRCWLIGCIADLIATKLLPLLKEREFLSVGFLEKLAIKLNNLAEDENDLFYPVFSRLHEAFMNEEFLPANDETFISAQNAKLADSEGLIELLKPNQLSLLFKRSNVTRWLVPDITARRAQNLWKYLRMELKIDEVDPEMFARRIDKSFLEQQDDDWFIDFYKFLSVGERPPRSLWTSPSGILQRPSILRNKPILRLQDNSLVNPDEPSVYLTKGTDSETTSQLIKSEISQNEDAHKFLKELGIPEWDVIAEVIEDILPKYTNNSPVVSKAEHERDFSKIVQAYETDSQTKRHQLGQAIMITSLILVDSPDASDQMYLKPNDLYFGTDRLWRYESTENYTPVSVSKEVDQFLKELGVSQWDIVEEVVKTVLPKYKQNPPRVPITTHINDFEKIILAYKTSNQFRKADLKTELQATHFILAENPDPDFPIYLSPNNLYFPTDNLRKYFEYDLAYWIEIWNDGNDDLVDLWNYFVFYRLGGPPLAGAFIDLDKYPDTARTLFEDLGVADTVRVERKRKDSQGRVSIIDMHSHHRRGLDGFDPDIYVNGLDVVIERVNPEKSIFIWNEIAIPNADCIRGTIETSRNQQYRDSQSVEDISKQFGRLLIDTKWLPDSDGNMHKPSEITLAELPEEFIRNERLADQLRMKKDEMGELAEKTGVPIEVIREFSENPEGCKEFLKEWQAKKTKQEQIPSPKSEEPESNTIPYSINYSAEIEKSFNKSGITEVKAQIIDDGKVKNPERRREKTAEEHRDRLNRVPSPDDRRKETYRTILEGPDPQVREYLSQMYGGKCQICDDTFPERDGKPFFVASYIVERQKSEGVDTSANALCLCADHFAKFKHGAIEAEDIPTQIKNFQTEFEGGDCKPILDIKLCGDKCEIRFKEKHLMDLQELIKVSNDD